MTTAEFLSHLNSLDVELWAEADKLRINAPKGALTPDIQAELRKRKEEILLLLLKSADTKGVAAGGTIGNVDREGDLQLSFAQERLWFLYHLFPENPGYNVSFRMRLAGVMDALALQKSLQALVDRHESLRTCFPAVDGKPVQVIRDDCRVPITEHDLKELREAERERTADKLIEEEILRPFDLTHGPVIRAALVRMADHEHILLITIHHIVTDGWSRGIIQRDLSALYNAQVLQQTPILPALPIQYVDFAHWQRQRLTGEVLEEQLRYWRTHLAALSTLDLPTDRPRPPVPTHTGASHTFQLSRSLTRDLQALSRQAEVTLATTLLAAFQVLLARYTGQTDIAVGSPIANRTRSELENLVGFFVNSLVMRADLSADPSFRELLTRVNEVALGAYEHQDLPFEQLVAELQPERDFSRNPLFQVVFAFQNVPREALAFQELTIRPIGKETTTTRMDLECFAWEGKEGLYVTLVFNTGLFDRATIERFGAHFRTVLTEVVSDPTQRLSQVSLLDEAERQQVLVEWNATETTYPPNETLASLFEGQVRRSPDRVALVFEDQELTYLELNRRANQLAHHLQKLGVGPDVLVGVFMERSIEMVVALLAVLKTGAAYVPLDPAYPRERLAFMLGDAQVSLLLTSEGLSELLPEQSAQTVYMDAQWPTIAQADESNLAVTTTPESPAYVLYTSGSTGTPKGVVGRHRGAVNRFAWMWDQYPFAPHEVCCQKTSLNFVDSVWEIFGPLLQGVPIVIIPNPLLTDPPLLIEFLAQHRVTRMVLVPSLLRVLLETYDDLQDRLPQLTHWICSGEALSLELYNRFQALMPQSTLLNLYGSSEVAADVTCFDTRRMHPEASSVPIGRPIANTELYVLDRHLSPVPIGVPAELYVGGAGLAQGYLNRPDLTEERFIPNPFGREPDARLYKTGDIVRYLPDGNLEYLGRIDHQVKIRGFRIELGEIETVLASHPAVRETVVVIREDVADDKRIVAYVVPSDEPLSPRDLRQALKQRLPEYMVPAHFVMLDALPLTPNRKVDRRALPAPEGLGVEPEAEYVAPSTPDEEVLAGIWAQVLGLERVGVRDNFFELGGHSLLATQVMSRVRDGLGVEVPLRALFEGPTVAELAGRVATLRQAEQGLEALPLVGISRHQPLALSFAQQRLWFLDQLEPNQSAVNLPWAVRLTGSLEVGALEQALSALVDRHEVLRTTFAAGKDGEPIQVIAPAGGVELEHVELASLAPTERDAELQRQMGERAKRPFDLATGPVLRATLYRLAPEEHVLALTIHHIAFDGWSFGVLARELGALYAALVEGREPALPPLPVQYADYAAWQRQWLQGEVLEAQLEYWRRQLGSELPVLELPTDHPRSAVQSFAGARESYALPEPLLASLRSLSQREGVTLFMTLAAVLKVLFHRYSGQSVITIGTPVANRTRSALESLIGFFVNSLVLSTELKGELSFREALARVREVSLGAYAHQDLPFEQLVEAVSPQRDQSRHPLFQVMFALQNVPSEAMELLGLRLSALPVERSSSQFDLTLFARERGGRLHLIAEYNTDLFERETIRRMLGHYETLLAGAVADPEQAISWLPLLSEGERRQLLVEWNTTRVEVPQLCIHEVFESQGARTPTAPAVEFEDQKLTYQDLNTRANQLAHHLRGLGIGPGALVGIFMHRSNEVLVGMLGVLKAGGAYVPLDPAYPGERLAFMAADSGVKVLLTQHSLVESLPPHQAQVVCLDTDWDRIAQGPMHRPVSEGTAEHLAVVIYTSGSTGKPKGVALCHRTMTNLIAWQAKVQHAPSDSTTLQFASLSFDVSLQEIFSTLATGGRLLMIPESTRADFRQLLDILDRQGVQRVFLPFVALQQLANAAEEHGRVLPSLQEVITAGEQLKISESIARFMSHRPDGILVNQYGPSESHVVSSYDLTGSREGWPVLPPIGRPIDNTQLYVLDARLEPVPIGAIGELYIGGTGLAREYLNQPELTAEQFVPHPFSADPGARLYRTGDQARYQPDGNLEFLGRRDHQVKLRGYRIELGEIEAVLSEHPAVDEAVALVREETPGDQRLVTYVVSPQGVTPSEVRQHLKQTLPEYMVPAHFVMLDAFPLTPNRKVDRRALPAPEGLGVAPETAYVAPSTPDEEVLAGIWAQVLGLERIGTEDNFFELGGHSLLATQVISRMENAFGMALPLRTLFERPTVAGLATALLAQELETIDDEQLAEILTELESSVEDDGQYE